MRFAAGRLNGISRGKYHMKWWFVLSSERHTGFRVCLLAVRLTVCSLTGNEQGHGKNGSHILLTGVSREQAKIVPV